jgi:excisionase family DNA binding protein
VSHPRHPRATLTAKETSKLLRLSLDSTYQAIRLGEIPSVKVGRRVLVHRVGLDRLVGVHDLTLDELRGMNETKESTQQEAIMDIHPIPDENPQAKVLEMIKHELDKIDGDGPLEMVINLKRPQWQDFQVEIKTTRRGLFRLPDDVDEYMDQVEAR